MSTQTPQPPLPASSAQPRSRDDVEIRIVSHSNLFYWWPVWAVGFLLGILTWMEGYVMAVVPNGSKADRTLSVQVEPGKSDVREGIVLPPQDPKNEKHLPPDE